MKYLKLINEFASINEAESKKIKLSISKDNRINTIERFLRKNNITWYYSNKFSTGIDCIIVDRLNSSRYKKIEPVVYLKFQDNNKLDKFVDNFKHEFINHISVKKDTVAIQILYSAEIIDYIKRYKEDISDALLELEDIGYNLSYSNGIMQGCQHCDDFNERNIGYTTTYFINVVHKDVPNEEDDDYIEDDFDSKYELDRLKTEEDFIKNKNLYSRVISVIRRIQSFGLKILFSFYSFREFIFCVVCEEDENFKDITLL